MILMNMKNLYFFFQGRQSLLSTFISSEKMGLEAEAQVLNYRISFSIAHAP